MKDRQKNLIQMIQSNKNAREIYDLIEKEKISFNEHLYTGSTILISAIENHHVDLVKLLLTNEQVNINQTTIHPRPVVGLTPLMISVWNQDIDCASIILQTQRTRLDSDTPGGHTALTNAVEKQNIQMVTLILQSQKKDKALTQYIHQKRKVDKKTALDIACEMNALEIIDALVKAMHANNNYPSYSQWLQAQHKLPKISYFEEYLKELNTDTLSTGAVKKAILDRKLWADVVSDFDRMNQQYIVSQNIHETLEKRLQKFGFEKGIVSLCIEYLKNCPLVMTFNAKFLAHGLTDYRPLNFFEKGATWHSSGYGPNRVNAERVLFQHVTDSKPLRLKQRLLDSHQARPKYGALILLDRYHPIESIGGGYGQSFVVFRDLIKHNSLFVPADSLNNVKQNYIPSTYHHFELFLLQCSDNKLKAIANRVTKGQLTNNYNFHNTNEDGYIEVLLPSLDLLDKKRIEHIYIKTEEYKLSEAEKNALKELGISVTNENKNPYPVLSKQFMDAIEKNNVASIQELSASYPSLLTISTAQGLSPLQIAEKLNHKEIISVLTKVSSRKSATSDNENNQKNKEDSVESNRTEYTEHKSPANALMHSDNHRLFPSTSVAHSSTLTPRTTAHDLLEESTKIYLSHLSDPLHIIKQAIVNKIKDTLPSLTQTELLKLENMVTARVTEVNIILVLKYPNDTQSIILQKSDLDVQTNTTAYNQVIALINEAKLKLSVGSSKKSSHIHKP